MKIDKGTMRALRYVLVICCVLLFTLTACSQSPTQSDSSGSASPSESGGSSGDVSPQKYVKIFGKPYSDIFQLLEEGKYGKAEDIIEEDIIGDSIKEKEAENKVKEYYQLLVERFNHEMLSKDDFWFIHENLCKTEFSAYADSESIELMYILDESKSAYQNGRESFNAGNYADAMLWLPDVSPLDTNYGAAIDTISDIAAAWGNSEDLRKLRTAVSACDILNSRRNNSDAQDDESSSALWRDNIITDEKCIETKLRFAQHLEMNRQYRYAIQQYAQLIIDYDYMYDGDLDEDGVRNVSPAYSGYCLLMWMLNNNSVRKGDPYLQTDRCAVKLLSGGLEEYISIAIHPPQSVNGFSDVDPLWIYTGTGTNYYGGDVSDSTAALADSIKSTPGITKVVTDGYIEIATLLYDGTVRFFSGEDRSWHGDLFVVESWNQIIDLWYVSDGFIGLADSGDIVITPNLTRSYPALTEARTWEDVISVSFGFEQVKGYISSATYTSLYALCGDGTVRYIKDFNHDRNSSVGVVQANAVAIAGSYYLDSEGCLHTSLDSLSSEVDKWRDTIFTDIISPCNSESHGRSKPDEAAVTAYDAFADTYVALPNTGIVDG